MKTVVVVVTWNNAETIVDALTSVPEAVPVVIVDNASSDATVDVVRDAFPQATITVNEENVGFAVGVNQAVASAPPSEYVLMLNPDARLEAGALEHLESFADQHPKAGIVSALVLDPDGAPEKFLTGREVTLLTTAVHEFGLARALAPWSMYRVPDTSEPSRADWVAGTCVLARRRAFEAAAGFDPYYFFYCEDRDLARRLRALGWEVWIEPAARAFHRGGHSVTKVTSGAEALRLRALHRYYARDHRGLGLVLFRLLRLIGSAVRAAAFTSAGAALRRAALRQRGRQRARDAAFHARVLAGRER